MSDDPYHLSGLPFKRVSLASTLAGPYQQLARQSHSSRRLRRRFDAPEVHQVAIREVQHLSGLSVGGTTHTLFGLKSHIGLLTIDPQLQVKSPLVGRIPFHAPSHCVSGRPG